MHNPHVPATLTSIRIRNLALVEELAWEIASGFVAVTGETGSGKSIVIGALKLLLGDRADKSLIRTGADACSVEAVFEMENTRALDQRLDELGLEPCSGNQMILKRTFSVSGANRQYVNCSATTLAVLKEIGDGLVDLHGPHDHQSLLSIERQLDLLDSYAGADGLLEEFSANYHQWQRLVAEHSELANSEAALERELDLLRHQSAEIEAAQLDPEEEAALLHRYNVASNSKRLIELATGIVQRLAEADDAILPQLSEVQRLFKDLERLDPAQEAAAQSHAGAVDALEEIATELQRYVSSLDLDPEQLAELESRVSLIETLKRKYGPTIPDVIAFGESAAARLRKIESRGEELERLQGAIEAAHRKVSDLGEKLSALRKKAAPKLASAIRTHLRDLGFKKSEFSVAIEPLEKISSTGIERVEFMFAPNLGEPEKPLKATASSGEISRVMLAVKSALAAQDRISLLVFDEIDANVGGEIAHSVAAKMRSLAERHQVLCITHLPQVAAAAGAQYVVRKEYENERTTSSLSEVKGRSRVEEIARMLGGQSKSAVAHAEELLKAGGKA